ncbi:hypothetical protein HMI54_005388 [Coelomomyces lativittatus]|nr:hypothetical protein HMI56_002688 [Coelomomyces lativittatus]KAJ1506058.1 hypothetical protein HMI54_005388 [Coelomomyces lativittatus]KAJ1518385.1 hypothetical protein HMI55_005694 [Coelomomyces lativittatus]
MELIFILLLHVLVYLGLPLSPRVRSLPVILDRHLLIGWDVAFQDFKDETYMKLSSEHENPRLKIRSPIDALNNTSLNNVTSGAFDAQNVVNSIEKNLTSLSNITLNEKLPLADSFNNNSFLQTLAVKLGSLDLNISSMTNRTWNITSKLWPAISMKGSINNYTISGKMQNFSYSVFNTSMINTTIENEVVHNLNFTAPFDPKLSGTNESQIRPLPWTPKALNGSLSSQGVEVGEISDISNLDPLYEWKKVIVDDFSKNLTASSWKVISNCQPGQVTCFIDRPENVKVFNNSLIISAMAEQKSTPIQYTSGRVYTEFLWPENSTLLNLWINAELPNVDSVVPILKLIINNTIVIDLTSPQVTTNATIVMGNALPSQNRIWEVTVDRVKGHVQMGKDGFQAAIPVLQGDMNASIVLSTVIRTSEQLPNGPLFWFGPSEDKNAMKLYKRQVTDQGLVDIWTLTVYLVKTYYTLT